MAGMTLTHGLQGVQCGIALATFELQLRVSQGNGQFSLRLLLQRTLEQGIALLMLPQLVRGAGSAEVIHQRLAIGLSGA